MLKSLVCIVGLTLGSINLFGGGEALAVKEEPAFSKLKSIRVGTNQCYEFQIDIPKKGNYHLEWNASLTNDNWQACEAHNSPFYFENKVGKDGAGTACITNKTYSPSGFFRVVDKNNK